MRRAAKSDASKSQKTGTGLTKAPTTESFPNRAKNPVPTLSSRKKVAGQYSRSTLRPGETSVNKKFDLLFHSSGRPTVARSPPKLLGKVWKEA